jgi:outer membrane immunogenic protein
MKKILGASVAVAALMVGGLANAADMPAYKAPPPVAAYYDWTGLYFGGFAGAAWGDSEWSNLDLVPGPAGQVNPRFSGALFGLQVGVNYQIASWVIGAEADYGWTNGRGSRSCPLGLGNLLTCHSDLDAIATYTGRIGYAWDRALTYVKAGGAWSKGEHSVTLNTPIGGLLGGQVLESVQDNRTGWTVGGGMEFGFTPNFSAKAEYDYMDFGTKRLTMTGNDFADFKRQIHAVKIGLNYRIGTGGGVYAKY